MEIRKTEYGHWLIRHNDCSYTLKEDQQGRLIISAGGNGIVIKPVGSNCVEIDNENN